ANNRAAAQARGDILLFLNNDTVTTGDFVTPVLREFDADPALGVVGPMLANRDGTFQLSSGLLPTVRVECVDKVLYSLLRRRWGPAMRYAERARRGRTVQWVTGAALFIRSDVFRQLGGFDERFFMFFEDKDLCARALRKGYRVKYVSTPSLTHLGGGSSGTRREEIEKIYRQSQIVYYEKHRPKVEQAFMKVYLRLAGKAPEE
ncbi:MAG: glycosyltransferase family 2 protein, partial [Ignavibacteriales bacterium]|nr:glycosyltransferase family 2 protein [Ignavibacteriales bacterium]